MSTQNIPIINKPSLYMDGLMYHSIDSNVIVDIGKCRDINNVMDIVVSAPITINILYNGAGGLDTGDLAINSCYAVCVIADSSGNNEPSAMIFYQYIQSEPIFPPGYDCWRLVGYITTDGTKQINGFTVFGDSTNRYLKFDSLQDINPTGAITTSFQYFDASHIFPNIPYQLVDISISFTPSVALSVGNLATFDTDPKFYTTYGIVASIPVKNILTVLISDAAEQTDNTTIGIWASAGSGVDNFVFNAHGFIFDV